MKPSEASPPPPSVVSATPQTSPEPPVNLYARFDPLREKGLNITLPGPAETIDRRFFSVRDALADAGIGYIGISNSLFEDNLLRHGHPAPGFGDRQNQLYNGQLPTYATNNYLYFTYDLSRYGIPDGQIVIGGTFLRTNWNPLGPNSLSLSTASYYQTLFNGAVELKVGYLTNTLEFLQTLVGGNIAGGIFGPSASLITEQGESTTTYPAPGVNITVHLPANTYTKLGVQRALSPDGVVAEHNENTAAVDFTAPNAGALLIDEFGYRVAPAPGVPQTWIRGAVSYTSSSYRNYSKSSAVAVRSEGNYGLFLLADRQLWQTAPFPGTAGQGIYAGLSVEYAPPNVNRFSQYYEGRIYGIGLIPGRPRDQISFVLTDNVFSNYLVHTARRNGQLAHDNTVAATLSYSARVFHGAYLNTGFSYVNNPTSVTYTERTGSALNLLVGSVLFF